MKTFRIHEDVKKCAWRRYFYEVEAENLQDAVNKVVEGDADCYDSEELYEWDEDLYPEDNGGCATREISDGETSEIIWNNVDNE